MSNSNRGADNSAQESDFDPATITAATLADDLPDIEEEPDEEGADNDSDEDGDNVAPATSAGEDGDDENDEGESDEDSTDETPADDEDDVDNSDDSPVTPEAEIEALFKDDKPPKEKEIKDWLLRKEAGVRKVVGKYQEGYKAVEGLVKGLKDAEDRQQAPDVAYAIVNQIARHHGVTPEELMGGTFGASGGADDGLTGDDEISDDDLALMSMSDPDDRKRLQAYFNKPILSKLGQMEASLAQINQREAERAQEDGLRKAAGSVIRDVEKNLFGWKVTSKMVVEAQRQNPELFNTNRRKAVQAAFPQEYAEHFISVKTGRAKQPTNGKMLKGDSRPTVAAKFNEDDPDSISSSQFN